MEKAEFYRRLSARFEFDFEGIYPDPKTLKNEDDMWDGNDICEYLGIEKRGNRSFVDDLITEYLKEPTKN